MNKYIKWVIVFAVLTVWTLHINSDKVKALETPLIYEVEALSFNGVGKTIIIYNYDTKYEITEQEMEHILFWDEFYFNKVVLVGEHKDKYDVYALDIHYSRTKLRKNVCAVGKLLYEYPQIIQRYPALEKYKIKCISGSKGGAPIYFVS